ncbi:hypothetical protein PVIIG_04232 [Plasmodium vivax India VII]|uniref:HAD domain ookinete protein n=6 Tax=Plasmodium vivax TaxID=5855 RepID=A5K637_PLAVS|nr:hypothetical protein, conserved [Plasmodium vivax]KMZ81733.1 hypothetical protein PVIIG_04232 [Plasmodium vivax India VII]KMZ87963.1 hypothetical protein PVBG_05646 [Plasmodium vivax Brazil I]KMZ94626.1 hypothetical protein PVMG_01982 [Plasmodium vivax Mauritania I]KNA01023.1 hypothetical protein PVNG_05652 [Plasmodium vivax North Korean]EDL45372.1 hypothetical protein, conserved [Plasmodium vivax]|eukprot:XP_001615099.1 hypothetical protein [Plasmodium vivax Sal-1]
MNLPHDIIPSNANENLIPRNVDAKNRYKRPPFSGMDISSHLSILPFPQYNANFLFTNDTKLKMYKNKVFGIPIDITDLREKSKHFNNTIGGSDNGRRNLTYQMVAKNDVQEKAKHIYQPAIPKTAFALQLLKRNMKGTCGMYLEKCKRVIIFDLDDTLIPTNWIRSFLLTRCAVSYKQGIKELKKEIQLNKKCNFESVACSVIHLAMSLSHTVFIVTNARSDKWIETVRWLFPRFSKLLLYCQIPIIRTDQQMEPSPLNVHEYFRFWMSAKKKKFDDILKQHCTLYRPYISNKIDFISLGDTDFEEVATYELQLANTGLINRAFNVKVQAGLSLEDFTGQLKLIQVALSIIAKGSYAYKYLALSGSVQIKM